jgi:hypothetical protein
MSENNTRELFAKNSEYLSRRELAYISEDISFENESASYVSPLLSAEGIVNAMEANEILAIDNLLDKKIFATISENSKLLAPNPSHETRTPLYLIYEKAVFEALLKTIDIEALSLPESVVFLCGKKAVFDLFANTSIKLPSISYVVSEASEAQLNECIEIRVKKLELNNKEIADYYSRNKDTLKEEIAKGHFRILFWTSKNSYVTYTAVSSAYEACKALGYEAELAIEYRSIECASARENAVDAINKFKPNVFFMAHFTRRHNQSAGLLIPDELYYVTWFMDLGDEQLSPETPKNMSERDFNMIWAYDYPTVQAVGYAPERTVRGLTPADYKVYKKYDLTTQEKMRFECDICLVTHLNGITECIKKFEDQIVNFNLSKTFKQTIRKIYYSLFENAKNGKMIWSVSDAFAFINEMTKKTPEIADEVKRKLANELWVASVFAYKTAVADWLIDGGYTNIKLWGLGWDKYEKYRPFACGLAKNGEELSKIYNGTKICPGINPNISAAFRSYEIIGSGAFYLCNYIPPENDVADIRKILSEGEDLILYNGKQDLLDKVAYYLKHEDERIALAERARERITREVTHENNMKTLFETMQKDAARRRERIEHL